MRRALWACALVLFGASKAYAIVVVESALEGEQQEGWHGTLGVEFDEYRGNTRRQTFSAQASIAWRHDRDTEILMLDGARGTSKGVKDLERDFVHFRHRHQLSKRWAPELFAQYERDPFAKLRARTLFGAGLRLSLIPEDHAAYLGIGAFDERERYQSPPFQEHLVRGNLYLLVHHPLNAHARVDAVGYFQPALRHTSDRRVLLRAQLSVEAGNGWGLELAWEWTHDSRPPIGARRTNARLRTGMEWRF